MGRVLVGAVLGAVLGGMIGYNVKYQDAVIQTVQHTINLAVLLHYLSAIAGVSCGAIVGAVAGATSANPHSKPLSGWFWVVLAVLLVLAIAGAVVYWMSEDRPPPAPQAPPTRQGFQRVVDHEYASRSFAPRFAGHAVPE